ncbi:hypothetical protein D3C77_590810 [compost metagenome]
MRTLLVAVLLGGLARAGAGLAQQQRVGGQVLQLQAAAAQQRMVGARHGDDRVVQEREELQLHVGRHHGHDQQVVTVGAQALDRLGVIDHGQLQAHLRVALAKGGEQVRNEILGTGLHRQAQLAL